MDASDGMFLNAAIHERLIQGTASGLQSFNRSPTEALSRLELEVFESTGHRRGACEICNRRGGVDQYGGIVSR